MSTSLEVRSGDAQLAVKVDGSGELPWLILSNSLATNLSMWEGQLATLCKTHRVVRYDARGHGNSSAPDRPYDFSMLCNDVIAVMDSLKVETADILGLSLGGMTALGLGLDHPDRFNRVICCCARGDFPAAAIAMWDDRIKAVSESGIAAIADGTLNRWFTEVTHRSRPKIIDHARSMILSTSSMGYCGCADALKGLDYRRRLPAMRKRVLFVAGEHDLAATPDAMRDMADATPDALFKVIPAAAHIANMENSGHFNSVVSGFLASH